MHSELIFTIILSIFFISIIVGTVFVTFGSIVEKEILEQQLEMLSLSISEITELAGPAAAQSLITKANAQQVPQSVVQQDADAVAKNKVTDVLLIKFYCCFAGITAALLGLVWWFGNGKTFNKKLILMKVFLVCGFTAMVEILFIKYFVANFAIIDFNKIKLMILQQKFTTTNRQEQAQLYINQNTMQPTSNFL